MLPIVQWLITGAAAGVGYTVASKFVDAGFESAKAIVKSVGSGDDNSESNDEDKTGDSD